MRCIEKFYKIMRWLLGVRNEMILLLGVRFCLVRMQTCSVNHF